MKDRRGQPVRLRRSSLTTMLILLVLLVFSIATVFILQPKIHQAEAEAAELSRQNQALAAENEAIKEDIRSLGSDDAVIRIARERLDYCFDDEVIYVDTNQ